MTPKHVFTAAVGAALLAWGSLSLAQQYKADEFLGLDLSTAVFSPKPLGPAQEFAPVAVEARAERAHEEGHASAAPKAKAGRRVAISRIVVPKPRIAQMRREPPRAVAATRLARRHGNPLDAQAFDARIQVWPCKSGGICNWSR
jgi:hypothetical protein